MTKVAIGVGFVLCAFEAIGFGIIVKLCSVVFKAYRELTTRASAGVEGRNLVSLNYLQDDV